MARRVNRAKPDPTLLILLAAIGLVGVLVTRRYGLVPVLRTVSRTQAHAEVNSF